MLFFEPRFFAFFAVFFVLYQLCRIRLRLQNLLVLGGSYVFYGAWDVRFLMLIAVTTSIDFVVGLALSGSRLNRVLVMRSLAPPSSVLLAIAVLEPSAARDIGIMTIVGGLGFGAALWLTKCLPQMGRRKTLLAISVGSNLGILATFKYFDFFALQFTALINASGGAVDPVLLNLVLPVGISFYTFQTMSYTIDIYRRKLEPTQDIVGFAAFVAFFPQLVAGPIERASHLLPQFQTAREVSGAALRAGAAIFLWGLFKKTVIADTIAPFSDAVFSDPSSQPDGALLAGVLAFTFQIYCDFSGYSDMALGIARMLGFSLMVNFATPYFARTPSEFWGRWHISLSGWLRDYVYIPLGGNREGGWRTGRNLMLTMLLGGLWHGAAWTFLAWGAFHGALLSIYRVLDVDNRLARLKGHSAEMAANVAMPVLLFVAVAVAWVPFRANSFDDAFHIVVHMWRPDLLNPSLATVAAWVLPLLGADLFVRTTGREYLWDRMPNFAQLNVFLAVGYAVVLLPAHAGQPFIYFDF